MIVIGSKRYSEEYLKKAIALAVDAGVVDAAPHAGEKSHIDNGLSIQTPRGEMVAFLSHEGGEYPGVVIDIEIQGVRIGLATSEVDMHKNNCVRTRVWGDLNDDAPTFETFHGLTELEKESAERI